MWVSQNPCSGWRLAQTLLDSPLTSGLPDRGLRPRGVGLLSHHLLGFSLSLVPRTRHIPVTKNSWLTDTRRALAGLRSQDECPHCTPPLERTLSVGLLNSVINYGGL